jgi:hypothetical protein
MTLPNTPDGQGDRGKGTTRDRHTRRRLDRVHRYRHNVRELGSLDVV